MHMLKTIATSFLLSFVLLMGAPQDVRGETVGSSATDSAYRTALLELIATLQEQILLLQQELASREASAFEPSTALEEFSEAVEVVAKYEVTGSGDSELIDEPAHRDYFERMYEVMPVYYAEKFTSLQVFTGEGIYFDAFVETLPPDYKTWRYSVHEDALGEIDSIPTTELIVHELGHVVSLEAVPGKRLRINNSCSSYYERNGCPPLNSYLNEFAEEFWSSEALQRAKSFASASDTMQAVEFYYEQNADKYVTEYAAINPEEDFAETFMYFVMDYEVEGVVADEKITFFSSFSEMRELKKTVSGQL